MTQVEAKASAWDAFMEYLDRNEKFLSLREARKVVGGAAHLEALLHDGKVRELAIDPVASNCKRMFFASDVYSHLRSYARK